MAITVRFNHPFNPTISRLASLAVVLLLCLHTFGLAAADQESPDKENPFAGSRFTAEPGKVREGETIVYTLAVRAGGNEIPQRISVLFRPPSQVMLVSASPPMVYREEYHRELIWEGEIIPEQDLIFTITMVTMPDSARIGTLPANAGITWRPMGREWETAGHWLYNETKIGSKLTPNLNVLPNGMGIGKVEIVLLGYLIGGSLLIFSIPWLILRREKQRRAGKPEGSNAEKGIEKKFLFAMSFAFVCTLGVFHLMCVIALEDIRRFVAYEKVSCTILDTQIASHESSSSSRGGGPGPRSPSTTTVYNDPLVAVRYLAEGGEIIAVGSPRPTAMLSPLAKYALRELARYERGKSYPCWYDPREPESFVLARGVSWGWYLLGAGPLILLYFLGRYFLRRLKE
ncbi:MAG TPA: hypothetical protein DDY20_07880 [Desulfobulbaceae bacterium]|nr:hypothetical protein [Desulfobulbaceae bacterium]